MAGQAQTETWRRELAATFAAASSEVLYVVRLEPEAAVEFVSPGIFGLVGYLPAEFYADPLLWSTVVDRDAQDTISELTIGEAGEESNGIVRWVGKNGRPVWVHHRWLVVTRATGTKALYGAARALRNEQRGQDLAGQVDYLRLLLENVTDVVFDIAADGTFRWVSPSTEQVLGWRPGQLIGKTCSHFIDPETDEEVVAAGRDPDQYPEPSRRFRVRTADGGSRWMAGLWRETRDARGGLLGRIAGLHDIEDTVRAEAELASSREHYRLLAENGSDLVFRTSPGPSIVVEWVSPSITEILGWQPGDVVGQPVEPLLHPEDLKALGASDVDPDEPGRGTWEVRVRTATGGYRWMAVTLRSLPDSEGRIVARVGGARDMQAEVEARQRLARSERQFRLAMDSAPSGMAVVDLERRFVRVNPALCRMTGRDEEWLTGRPASEIVDAEFHERDERMWSQLREGGTDTCSCEKRLRRADGSALWVEHAVGVLRDETGAPLSVVCQYVDITDTKRVQADLEYRADHDPLTRLLTRRALLDGMERIRSHPRMVDARIGLLYIDVDWLKSINDTYGHAAGDRLLVEVAARICRSARADDLVARVGGDEMAVVLPSLRTDEDAGIVARKIHESLRAPIRVDGGSVQARVSIGIDVADLHEEAEAMLRRADRALYAAKQAGRDRTVMYRAELG